MAVMWHARDVPRRERVYYMRSVVASAIGSLDLRYEDKEQDFDGWLRAADFGPVRIVHTSAPPGTVERAPHLIRSTDQALCWVIMQLRGRDVLDQDGQQGVLRAGDFGFADLSRPCRVAGSLLEQAHVIFPEALLPPDLAKTRNLGGITVPGRKAEGAPTSSLLRTLINNLDDHSGKSAARIGAAVLDLIVAALADSIGQDDAVPPATRQRALMMRVHGFIEERLGDPRLSPPMIATAHHISPRYLHKLFAEEGKTVGGWIRHRRLERSRRDLLDPMLQTRPVRAIGARWGFTEPSAFSRVFRQAYGVSPSEYRRLSAQFSIPDTRRQ